MIDTLIFAFWFFLPAGIANTAPVIANKVPGLNKWQTPLDFGLRHRGKRIFGDNKRLRGIVFGTVIGVLISLGQYIMWPGFLAEYGIYFDVHIVFAIIFGALLGTGALLGDAVESYFKRQSNIPPGKVWFPFDQIDYIIGGLLAASLLVSLTAAQYISIFILYFGLHMLAAYVGYLLGLKDSPI